MFSVQNAETCDVVTESLSELPRVSCSFQLNLAFDGCRPIRYQSIPYTIEYMTHEVIFIASLKNISSYGKLVLTEKLT